VSNGVRAAVIFCCCVRVCRPSQQKHYPPSRRLLFHVLKGMPRLELSVAGLPTTAAVGELLRVQVRHLDVWNTSHALPGPACVTVHSTACRLYRTCRLSAVQLVCE
jgi:hypothetical protein